MICHATTHIGLTDRMEVVTSLTLNQATDGLEINGVRESLPNAKSDLPIFPFDTIVAYKGTKLDFFCNGKSYSYRVRNKTDMLRIINEVNFLLDLEGVNAL